MIALGGAVLLTLLVPGLAPWSPAKAADAATPKTTCAVSYGALDPGDQTKVNPNKEVPGAVGPAVTQRDIPGIKAELKERRTCGTDGKFDPELTATHYADWSAAGLTSHPIAFADIDAFRAQMVANPDLYASTVNELETLENGSTASIQNNVPAGVWSVYVLPDGKGSLTTHIGTSSHVGTAIVFTHGDVVVKYRLECGFQILRQTPPAGMQQCTFAECGPPPHVPTCQEMGNCSTPGCTSDCGGTPTCTTNCTPPPCTSCLTPKDPKNDVKPPQGTTQLGPDPVQPVAPAPKPNPVQPSTPVHQDPGPSVPVQGANPAPAAPPAPSIPAPQKPAPTDPGTPIKDPDA